MSLILRRKASGPGVDINAGQVVVRVVKVDPDGTVHLAFQASKDTTILREELLQQPIDYVGEVKRVKGSQ